MSDITNLQTLHKLSQATLSQDHLCKNLVDDYTVGHRGQLVKKSSLYGRVIQLIRVLPYITSSSQRVKEVTAHALQSLAQLELTDDQLSNYIILRRRLVQIELAVAEDNSLVQERMDQQTQNTDSEIAAWIEQSPQISESDLEPQLLWQRPFKTTHQEEISINQLNLLVFKTPAAPKILNFLGVKSPEFVDQLFKQNLKVLKSDNEVYEWVETFKNFYANYTNSQTVDPTFSTHLTRFLDTFITSRKELLDFEAQLLQQAQQYCDLTKSSQDASSVSLVDTVQEQISSFATKIHAEISDKIHIPGTTHFLPLGVQTSWDIQIQNFLAFIKQQSQNVFIPEPINKPVGEINIGDILSLTAQDPLQQEYRELIDFLVPHISSISLLDILHELQRHDSTPENDEHRLTLSLLQQFNSTGLSEYHSALSLTLIMGTERVKVLCESREALPENLTNALPSKDIFDEVTNRLHALQTPSALLTTQGHTKSLATSIQGQNAVEERSSYLKHGLLKHLTTGAIKFLYRNPERLGIEQPITQEQMQKFSDKDFWLEIDSNGTETFEVKIHRYNAYKTKKTSVVIHNVPINKLSKANIEQLLSFKFLPQFDPTASYSFDHLLQFITQEFGDIEELPPQKSTAKKDDKNSVDLVNDIINDKNSVDLVNDILSEKIGGDVPLKILNFYAGRTVLYNFYHQALAKHEANGGDPSDPQFLDYLRVSLLPHTTELCKDADELYKAGHIKSQEEVNELYSTLRAAGCSQKRIKEQEHLTAEKHRQDPSSTQLPITPLPKKSLSLQETALASAANAYFTDYYEGLVCVEIARDYIGPDTANLLQIAIDANWPDEASIAASSPEIKHRSVLRQLLGSWGTQVLPPATSTTPQFAALETKGKFIESICAFGEVIQTMVIERESPYLKPLIEKFKQKKISQFHPKNESSFFLFSKIHQISTIIFKNTIYQLIPRSFLEKSIDIIARVVYSAEKLRRQMGLNWYAPLLYLLPREQVENCATELLVHVSPYSAKLKDFTISPNHQLYVFDSKNEYQRQATSDLTQMQSVNLSIDPVLPIAQMLSKIGHAEIDSSQEQTFVTLTNPVSSKEAELCGQWEVTHITWPESITTQFPSLLHSPLCLTRNNGELEILACYQQEHTTDSSWEYAVFTLDENYKIDTEKLKAAATHYKEHVLHAALSTLSLTPGTTTNKTSSSLIGIPSAENILLQANELLKAPAKNTCGATAPEVETALSMNTMLRLELRSSSFTKIPLSQCRHKLSFLGFDKEHYFVQQPGKANQLHLGNLSFQAAIRAGKEVFESLDHPGYFLAGEQLLPSDYPVLSHAFVLENSKDRIAVIDPSLSRHRFSALPRSLHLIKNFIEKHWQVKIPANLQPVLQGLIHSPAISILPLQQPPYCIALDNENRPVITDANSAFHILFDAVITCNIDQMKQATNFLEQIAVKDGLSIHTIQQLKQIAFLTGCVLPRVLSNRNTTDLTWKVHRSKSRQHRSILTLRSISIRLQTICDPKNIQKVVESPPNVSVSPAIPVVENDAKRKKIQNVLHIAQIFTKTLDSGELSTLSPQDSSHLFQLTRLGDSESLTTDFTDSHLRTIRIAAVSIQLISIFDTYLNWLKDPERSLAREITPEIELRLLRRVITLKDSLKKLLLEELNQKAGHRLDGRLQKLLSIVAEAALLKSVHSEIYSRYSYLEIYNKDFKTSGIQIHHKKLRQLTNRHMLHLTQVKEGIEIITKEFLALKRLVTRLPQAIQTEADNLPSQPVISIDPIGHTKTYFASLRNALFSPSITSELFFISLKAFNPLITANTRSDSSDLFEDIKKYAQPESIETLPQLLTHPHPLRYEQLLVHFHTLWSALSSDRMTPQMRSQITSKLKTLCLTNNNRQKMLVTLLLTKAQQSSSLAQGQLFLAQQTQRAGPLLAQTSKELLSMCSFAYDKFVHQYPDLVQQYNLPNSLPSRLPFELSQAFTTHLSERGFSLERANELLQSLTRPLPDSIPSSRKEFERFCTETLVADFYMSIPSLFTQSLIRSTSKKSRLTGNILNDWKTHSSAWISPWLAVSGNSTSLQGEESTDEVTDSLDSTTKDEPIAADTKELMHAPVESLYTYILGASDHIQGIEKETQSILGVIHRVALDFSIDQTTPIDSYVYPQAQSKKMAKAQYDLQALLIEKITVNLSVHLEDQPERRTVQHTSNIAERCLLGETLRFQELRLKKEKLGMISCSITALKQHCARQSTTISQAIAQIMDPTRAITSSSTIQNLHSLLPPSVEDLTTVHKKRRYPTIWKQADKARKNALLLTSHYLMWQRWADHLDEIISILHQCETKCQKGVETDELHNLLYTRVQERSLWISDPLLSDAIKTKCAHFELENGRFLSKNELHAVKENPNATITKALESAGLLNKDPVLPVITLKPLSACDPTKTIVYTYPLHHIEIKAICSAIKQHFTTQKDFEMPIELLQELENKRQESLLSTNPLEVAANKRLLKELFDHLSQCRHVNLEDTQVPERPKSLPVTHRITCTLQNGAQPIQIQEIHTLFRHITNYETFEGTTEKYLETHITEKRAQHQFREWNAAKNLLTQLKHRESLQFFSHSDNTGLTFYSSSLEDTQLLKENPKALLLTYLLYLCEHIHEISDLDKVLPSKMSPLAAANLLKKELKGDDPLAQALEALLANQTLSNTEKEKRILLTTPVCAILSLFGGPTSLQLKSDSESTLNCSPSALAKYFPLSVEAQILSPETDKVEDFLTGRITSFKANCKKVHRETLSHYQDGSHDMTPSNIAQHFVALRNKAQSGIIIDTSTAWSSSLERDESLQECLEITGVKEALPEGFTISTFDEMGNGYVWSFQSNGKVQKQKHNPSLKLPPSLILLLPQQLHKLPKLQEEREQGSKRPLLVTGPYSEVAVLLSIDTHFDLIDLERECTSKDAHNSYLDSLIQTAFEQ